MDHIFYRGDYRAFLVVATASHLDAPHFAFPIFENQSVSEVFDLYKGLYVPRNATISLRNHDMDDPTTLGRVFANVKLKNKVFWISTIVMRHNLWPSVVERWETQWVFDHLKSMGHQIPETSDRVLTAPTLPAEQVRRLANEAFNRYMLLTLTLYTAFIFTRNP